jgi:hypothetical protein
MKDNSLVILLGVVIVLLLGFIIGEHALRSIVPAAHADEECSVNTLQGSYLVTGRADPQNGAVNSTFPREHLAVWNFDGQGNMSGFATASDGGTITYRQPVTATYTLDSNCTGKLMFVPGGGEGWELIVTHEGSEGRLLSLNSGSIATRSIKRR